MIRQYKEKGKTRCQGYLFEHKCLLFSVKTHTDLIFTIWMGQLGKNFGASVLGLGLRRTFLSIITEANSMNSNMENDVANSDLLMPRDMFLFR